MPDIPTTATPGPNLVDPRLAAAFVAGDPAAFETVFRQYVGPIHDYVLGVVRNHALAEDITQTTFVRAWGQRATLREPAALRGWLYRIAHNAAINHVARARPIDELTDAAPLTSDEPGPERRAEQQDASRLVWDAAASLEPRQFEMLDLTVRKGLSSAEIADVLGIERAQASLAVHRAREALGNAVRYLLVARRRRRCDGLAALVPDGVARLTPEQRGSVDHHMRRCAACQQSAALLTRPEVLFGTIPIALVPARLLGRHAQAISGMVASARSAMPPLVAGARHPGQFPGQLPGQLPVQPPAPPAANAAARSVVHQRGANAAGEPQHGRAQEAGKGLQQGVDQSPVRPSSTGQVPGTRAHQFGRSALRIKAIIAAAGVVVAGGVTTAVVAANNGGSSALLAGSCSNPNPDPNALTFAGVICVRKQNAVPQSDGSTELVVTVSVTDRDPNAFDVTSQDFQVLTPGGNDIAAEDAPNAGHGVPGGCDYQNLSDNGYPLQPGKSLVVPRPLCFNIPAGTTPQALVWQGDVSVRLGPLR